MERAQSTLEYVILLGVVVGALIVISAYVGRGFQGRVRDQADQIAEQYSPKHMAVDINKNWRIKLDDKYVYKTKVSTSNTTTNMTTSPGFENITESW